MNSAVRKILFVLFVLECLGGSLSPSAFASEKPAQVSLCQLLTNPQKFNQRQVRLTAFLRHGFEQFTIRDPECPERARIWVEYGGTKAADTIYCCGRSPEQVVKERFQVQLKEDRVFKRLQTILSNRRETAVRSVLVGRFFSSRVTEPGPRALVGGYGHMGCCDLFVIEQIVHIDYQPFFDADEDPSISDADIGIGCSYKNLLPFTLSPFFIAALKAAEADPSERSFYDPLWVAKTALADKLGLKPENIGAVEEIRQVSGRQVFQWKKSATQRYWIDVSKPYWLSFYARHPQNLPWIVLSLTEIVCERCNKTKQLMPNGATFEYCE